MAIELNKRTKILAGVVVLAAVGAGAWFLFLEEFLSAPPPPPPKAAAAKTAPAGAPTKADAAKPAAAAPAAGAKPIPTNPDRLIAEVIETAGIKAAFEVAGRQVMASASASDGTQKANPDPEHARAVLELANRIFEPGKMTAELTANLKNGLDVERMSRFLEVLRQPVALKMAALESTLLTPEAFSEYLESARKSPPSPERSKLIQTLDEVSGVSEHGADMVAAMAREIFDTRLAQMGGSGKNAAPEERKAVADQMNAMRNQSRGLLRNMLHARYRGVGDDELAEYVKLLDTDTGRWGSEILITAYKPLMVSRSGTFGREFAQLARANRGASAPVAKAPARAPAEETPAEKPAAAPVAAPAEAPGYQRPANIRDAYSRYNDVITATVMRDRASVKELLDAGKSPNVKQSNGFTPLMVAVSNGDTEIAAMLLAKGADPNPRAAGVSALSIARSKGGAGAGMVGLLERSGAKN